MNIPPTRCVDREQWILQQCNATHILHIGCTDAPFTEECFAQGRLLHQRLLQMCPSIHGIDIDKDRIEWLRGHGVPNLFVHDCEHLESLGTADKYDVAIAGEVIEHLSNPGLFLASLHTCMKPGGVVLLTTANAFPIKTLLRLVLGREQVHPDHTFYFSYSTLHQLLLRHGWKMEEFAFYWRTEQSVRSRIATGVLGKVPHARYFADGVVLRARSLRP